MRALHQLYWIVSRAEKMSASHKIQKIRAPKEYADVSGFCGDERQEGLRHVERIRSTDG